MTASTHDRPWEGLDPGLAEVLRPELATLADETVAAISEGVPDYARPLEGQFGRDLRAGVEEALRQFVEMIERPGTVRLLGRELYVGLGRAEMRAGRSLNALLAAYRIGARVAWRRLAAAGVAAQVSPESLSLLAESIFAYIDELSAESVEGHAAEQAATAGEHQRLRRRLAGLLVADPPPDPVRVEAAAVESGWELPRALAAVAVPAEDADRLAGRLGPDALATSSGELGCVLVPDPEGPGRLTHLAKAFEGIGAALGPSVAWPDAGRSFARAAAALRLVERGALPAATLVRADRHLGSLVLHADPSLMAELARRRLAPLDGLGTAARGRACDTLRSWLRHQGRLTEVARELHVHPQTVRYRMGRLRERLGEAIDSPDARFELEMALRAESLGVTGPPARP